MCWSFCLRKLRKGFALLGWYERIRFPWIPPEGNVLLQSVGVLLVTGWLAFRIPMIRLDCAEPVFFWSFLAVLLCLIWAERTVALAWAGIWILPHAWTGNENRTVWKLAGVYLMLAVLPVTIGTGLGFWLREGNSVLTAENGLRWILMNFWLFHTLMGFSALQLVLRLWMSEWIRLPLGIAWVWIETLAPSLIEFHGQMVDVWSWFPLGGARWLLITRGEGWTVWSGIRLLFWQSLFFVVLSRVLHRPA